MRPLLQAAIGVAALTGVALLSGCSSGSGACAATLGEQDVLVVSGANLPPAAVASACGIGPCASAAFSDGRAEVGVLYGPTPVVTAWAMKAGATIAPPVTATVTPSVTTRTPQECTVIVEKTGTVTVTPTG